MPGDAIHLYHPDDFALISPPPGDADLFYLNNGTCIAKDLYGVVERGWRIEIDTPPLRLPLKFTSIFSPTPKDQP